jgi:hypothetical protein
VAGLQFTTVRCRLRPVGEHLAGSGDGSGDLTAITVEAQQCVVREGDEHLRVVRIVLVDPDVDLAKQAAKVLLAGCFALLNLCADLGRKVIHATWPACVTDPARTLVRCAHADSVLVPVVLGHTRGSGQGRLEEDNWFPWPGVHRARRT